MNILTPPTDNLYKFLAIFGLIIVITSIYLPFEYIFSSNVAYQPYRAAQVRLSDEQRFLRQDERLARTAAKPDRATLSSIVRRERDLTERSDSLKADMEQFAYYRPNLRVIVEVAWWFFIVGFLVMVLGFATWFFRLQRYEDRIATINPYTGQPLARGESMSLGGKTAVTSQCTSTSRTGRSQRSKGRY